MYMYICIYIYIYIYYIIILYYILYVLYTTYSILYIVYMVSMVSAGEEVGPAPIKGQSSANSWASGRLGVVFCGFTVYCRAISWL